MKRLFFGGVHPDDGKELTRHIATVDLPAPAQLTVPLSMHIGVNAKPLVSPGDAVKLGQPIGEAGGAVSSPVHSPVSGSVSAVEERLHPNGRMVLSVVIDNDGEDAAHESVQPKIIDESDYTGSVVRALLEGGVVGMGGATFPAHYKLSSGVGKADTLIINAAECEPYITSDHRTLLEEPDSVIRGIRYLRKALKLDTAIIGIEANKEDAVELLKERLAGSDDISICVVPTRYPQGGEKQLIQAITKRQVPPGGLPADVGCVVFNVFTSWSLDRAVETGIPVIDRVVTVSGPGIVNPGNWRVRFGTPIRDVIEACGGLKEDVKKVLLGGPMMGNAIFDLSVPVIKGTNSIVALSPDLVKEKEVTACIRCGRCLSVCPMKLQPSYLYQFGRVNDLDSLRKYHIEDCMECGSCAYICPGRLNLVQGLRSSKAKIREAKK
ncbi:MAG: electron transport complex subunit RsxC [Oscillospiraceae bacterium]|nr:electron transport complex subunit RsxC [Oscillospiraceae bacterium]